MAAGCLAVAASEVPGLEVDVVPPEVTDRAGDTELVERILAADPHFLGVSLYLWNVDRSLHVAREVKRRTASDGARHTRFAESWRSTSVEFGGRLDFVNLGVPRGESSCAPTGPRRVVPFG